jgi:nitric oxide reductase large subunit
MTTDQTLRWVALAFVATAGAFLIPGYLLNRSDSSRRFMCRMALFIFAGAAFGTWASTGEATWHRVIDYTFAVVCYWRAFNYYDRAEKWRTLERALRDRSPSSLYKPPPRGPRS